MSGDVELVKDASEFNYRFLEHELRDLAALATTLQETCPDNPLAAQVAAKATDLVQKFFSEAVPMLDCNVASAIVGEALKQNQTLATELNTKTEWLMNSSAATGNQ